MGNNAKLRTELIDAGAQASLDSAEYDRLFAEDILSLQEQLLGSDAQVAGTGDFGVGAGSLADYQGSYVLNPTAASALNEYYLRTGGSKLNPKLGKMDKKLAKLDEKNPNKAAKIRGRLEKYRGKYGGTLGEGGGESGGFGGFSLPGMEGPMGGGFGSPQDVLLSSMGMPGVVPVLNKIFGGIFDDGPGLAEKIAMLEAKVKGSSMSELQDIVGQMNEINQQALGAAQAGDLQGAQALKQAAQALEGMVRARGAEGSMGDLITWQGNEAGKQSAAARQLSSPMAKIVGGMVKQGREFLDPESATSQRFKGALSDRAIEAVNLGEQNAQRGIASESAAAQRQMRDIGLSRGSARSPMAQMAIAARNQERFGAQRAQLATAAAQQRSQILGEADKFFEQYSRQFAQSSAAFGQQWLQGGAGVRESFLTQMASLKTMSSQIALNAAGIEAQFALQNEALDAQRQSELISLGSSIGGSLLGAAGKVGGGMLCWAAAEYFGWFTPAWVAARSGIMSTWPSWAIRLYRRHGPKLAWAIRSVPGVKRLLRPVFERARRAGSR